MLQAITYLPSIIAVFLVSLIIFTGGTRKSYGRYFGLLNASILAWLLFQYLADISTSGNTGLYLIRLAISFSMLMPLFFLFFCFEFTETALKRKTNLLLVLPIACLSFLSLTDLIITEVKIVKTGIQIVNPGIGYTILTVFVVSYLLASILLLHRSRLRVDSVKRSQINLILLGAYFVTFSNIVTGYILPVLGVGDYANLAAGPSIAILVIAIARAMTRHHLFDIRAFFARSLGYVLITSFLSVLYGSILFISTRFIFDSFMISEDIRLIISTLLAVVLAFTLQPVKNFFSKVTNKFFYQDAYETQEILDRVSGIIVGNVDPHKIQKGALAALTEALKPTYAVFLLHQGNGLRRGDVIGQDWKITDNLALQAVFKSSGKRVVVYDELEEKQARIRDVLRAENISVVSPLVTKDEVIGYLVFGPKKSGNIYNSQDVGLLNIASNELAVALQNAQRFEEIQAFNVTLQEKVTEATRELKKTNKKLIALDEAKDEFISMASHQLRTPLTSIKGYLSMIIEGDLGKVSAPQEKALKEAFGSSQRMVYLIADFLNVSRIKTGKFVIEPKEVDLPQLVSEEITQLREMASSRDITLEYEPPGVFPRIQLDDNKIRQVMMNMVDNAIYYTPADGKVTIQLYVSGEEVIFKVIDTGIGVPKREQHKLFTKFFRANNARKARPDGTGLGLFMAQKIIVEQGGAIIFESTEGKGSTFGFRFPLAKIKVKT